MENLQEEIKKILIDVLKDANISSTTNNVLSEIKTFEPSEKELRIKSLEFAIQIIGVLKSGDILELAKNVEQYIKTGDVI